jgi:N-acetylmuramoyl-L-alanine amidase
MALYRMPGVLSDASAFVDSSRAPPSRSGAGQPASLVIAGGGVAAASAAQAGRVAGAGSVLQIDKDGMVVDGKVTARRALGLERGEMKKVNGIIVHQTGGATAQSALDSYKKKDANGAHFLIDKDGSIYQTASIYQRANHVGKLKSRCLVENRCTPAELKALKKFSPTAENKREIAKQVPDRYPSNTDSIGVEIVGTATKSPTDKNVFIYEAVNDQQNASLSWLVNSLGSTLGVSMTEVFRHPDVSRKQASEASSAKW